MTSRRQPPIPLGTVWTASELHILKHTKPPLCLRALRAAGFQRQQADVTAKLEEMQRAATEKA